MKGMIAYFRERLREGKSVLQKTGQLKSKLALSVGCLFFLFFVSLNVGEAVAVEIPYLDSTFDSDGIVTHDAAAGGNMDDTGNSVILDDNGNILVTGFSNTSSGNYDMTIWRYDSSGNLDATFGGGDGIVTHDSAAGGNGLDIGISITVDGSGNILVTGYSDSISSNYDMALWRYDSSGNLDTSFGGGDGIVTHNSAAGGNGQDRGNAVTVDGSGNILVTGYSASVSSSSDMVLWRYDSSGNLDTSFGGGDGIVTHNSAAGGDSIDQGISVKVDESGKIIVAGLSRNASLDHDLALWRFDNSGNLDTSFGGGDGIVTHNSAAGGNGIDYGFSVFVNSSGLVLVSGSSVNGSGDEDMVLWRYDSSGNLDTNFGGGDGIVTHNSAAGGNSSDRGNSVTMDVNGNILVAGYSENASANTDMVLWRYDSSGNLDTNFGGGDGVVTHNSAAGGDSFDFAESMTLDANGSILVAGRSRNASGNDDMAIWRYVSDTTQPITTTSPGFGSYSTPQAVALSCTDALGLACDTTYYCLGSGCSSFTAYSSGQFINISSSTDLRYYSSDLSGNTESLQTSSYTIGGGDITPPSTIASPGSGSYSASQSVTFSCSDGSGSGCDMTYYCLGSGCSSFTAYSGAGEFINISSSTDLRYYSSDLLGNTEGVKTVSYSIGEGEIGAIDWFATWDSGLYDVGQSVTIDGSGNILVAGYSNNGSNYDFALTRYVSEGVLDTSFGGGDGVVTWDGGSSEYGLSSATDGTGNIYVAGYLDNGPNMDFALVRFTSGGVLDTTFGGGDGVVTWDSGFDDYGYSVVVDGSGNILMAGRTRNGSGNYDFVLVRFTSAGVLDMTFGGGVVSWDGGSEDYGWSSIIDGAGNILVAGNSRNGSGNSDFALVRFTSGGVLDTSFGGGDGVVTWDSGSEDPGRSVALDGSGNIYVAGATHNGSNYDFTLVRFTSGGVLDANFGGGDGVVAWDVGSFDTVYSVATIGSGNILVAGSLNNGSNTDFLLLSFTSGGVLDTSFGGGDGVVTWDSGYADIAQSIVTDVSGNIFVAGYSSNGSDNDFMLIKYFVNDAPVITSDGGGSAASVNAAENQTTVMTVTATDPDSDPILYAISGGADQTVFNIHSSTGVLIFNSAPDYEIPGDSDANNIYIVDVTASDGAGTDIQTISVTVTDSEETTPTTTASPGLGSYSASQSVALSCDDGAGSGCASTYYCLGSGCSSFTVYSSTVSIISSIDLRYYSTDFAGNTESIKVASYTIDTLAPFGSVVIDGGNVFAHSSSVTLSLSAFDISSNVTEMQISNDGAFDTEPWESYSTIKEWTLSAGDGTKEVHVRFQDALGNVSPSYSDSITLDISTAPADVSNLNATPNDDGSITLYWTASISNDINGYNVYRDAVKVNSELIKITNYIDLSTTSGATYPYRVTSVGLTGKESSGASVEATSVVEGNIPPVAPDGINIENTGTGDSLKVIWPASSETDLNGYKVYWGTETGTYTNNFDVANLTSYTINDLTVGTLYYIAVTAYDTDLNESEKSIEQTATPELVATKPDPVTGLTVTEGNSYLTLDWNAVANISGYMVYIGESDGLYGVPVRTADTTYTFENLKNGKTYYVAVSSYDLESGHTYTASSVSDREASSGTPYDNDPPAIPGNLSASDAGTGGTVVLSWDRDDTFDIAGYVVTYKKTGDVVFEGVASTGISWSYAVTGLVDDVSYDFNAYAYDASGNFSEPVSVTETPTSSGSSSDIIPPEPPLLSALPGDNKVTLLITAPADDDVDHYNIYIYNLAAGKFMPLSSLTGLIHEENTVVTNGSVFDFVATAVDTSGNESGYSVPVSAVPNELPGDIEMENDPPVLDRVDGYDIVEIAKGFGKEIGHPQFNPNTDLNGDGRIDGEDVTILAPNHGKKKGP